MEHTVRKVQIERESRVEKRAQNGHENKVVINSWLIVRAQRTKTVFVEFSGKFITDLPTQKLVVKVF